MAAPAPEPVTLRVAVFEDDNSDARRQPSEPGLPDLPVQVDGPDGWSIVLLPGASGLVTVTLPGPGIYVFHLADRPGPSWEATTRTVVEVRVGADGSVVLLPTTDHSLPLGVAEGVTFAFGLVPVPPGWPSALLLVGGVLIWLARGSGRVRVAAAVEGLAEAVVELGVQRFQEGRRR